MNDDEYVREMIRQRDMVESIVRGHAEQEKEKAHERLSQLLQVLEMIAEDLTETITTLKNVQIR